MGLVSPLRLTRRAVQAKPPICMRSSIDDRRMAV